MLILTTSENGKTYRSMVVRSDALANDPVFMSTVGGQIRRIVAAVEALESFSSDGNAPESVVTLREALRAALDEYLSTVATDKAAE